MSGKVKVSLREYIKIALKKSFKPKKIYISNKQPKSTIIKKKFKYFFPIFLTFKDRSTIIYQIIG